MEKLDNKLDNKGFILDFNPKNVHPSINIGKLSLRTDVTQRRDMADLTLQISFLNEFFYRRKDVFFIHFKRATLSPDVLYKNYTSLLRTLNNSRWRKEDVSGFRLCNVVQGHGSWYLISDVATLGSRFAANIFWEVNRKVLGGSSHIFVSFNKPRKSLLDRQFKVWYNEFYEKTHLLSSTCKVDMIEPYYWRIDCNDMPYVVMMLFDIFGSRISSIYSSSTSGIEISQSPTIEADDYFTTDRHRCGCRIRFFQPFGDFFNMLHLPKPIHSLTHF